MKKLTYFCLFIFFTNALIFIFKFAEIPIFDDFEHLLDVHIYYQKGININSLMLHGNESGVFADWIWAIAGRIFGDSLVVYRLVDWVCLLIFFLILLSIAYKNTQYQTSIFVSVLFFMSSVYANLTVATVLTEAPSLLLYLCSCLGLMKYAHSQRSSKWFWLLASCVCMGICIITRFYQIALLGVICVFLLTEHYPKINFSKAFLQFIILLIGLLPFFGVIFLWKGIVPPSFKTRYPEYISEIGINVIRPFSVFLHIGIWGSPLVVLSWKWSQKAMSHLLTPNLKKLGIYCFLLAGILKWLGVYFWNFSIDNTVSSGLIDIVVKKMSSINYWVGVGTDIILVSYGIFFSTVIFYLIFQEIKKQIALSNPSSKQTGGIWEDKSPFSVRASSGELKVRNVSYCLVIILYSYLIFYILQQLFVTGNVQFFERYMLLIYPAMGFLIYQFVVPIIHTEVGEINRKLNWKLAVYLGISITFSCLNIWRYPFYGQSKKENFQKVETVKYFDQNLPDKITNH